jgi:hypothetical protein
MEIVIAYRPLTATLCVWNTIDDILSDDERESIVSHHEFGKTEDDDWHYGVSTYNGYFHDFIAMGIATEATAWNLWLSEYLPDEVVAHIAERVAEWNAEYGTVTDQRAQIMMRFKTEMTV